MNATSVPIEEIFTDDEQQIIIQALHGLRKVKQTAYEELEIARMTGIPMLSTAKQFQPMDFGIPTIEVLIARFQQ